MTPPELTRHQVDRCHARVRLDEGEDLREPWHTNHGARSASSGTRRRAHVEPLAAVLEIVAGQDAIRLETQESRRCDQRRCGRELELPPHPAVPAIETAH